MNKRRDALRRGIRSLIEDTSREFADLAELEPPPEDDGGPSLAPSRVEETLQGTAAVLEQPAVTPPAPPAPAARPAALRPADHTAKALPSMPPVAPPAPSRPVVPPPTPRPVMPPSAPRDAGVSPQPAAQRGVPVPIVPRQSPSRRPALRKSARGKARRGKASSGPRVPAGKARRVRRRVPDEIFLDGTDPRQVHARKGVCFAYFINKQCWRVPQAYCNTALHVCVVRECPVYRLHKDALERRFAEKYKHFW